MLCSVSHSNKGKKHTLHEEILKKKIKMFEKSQTDTKMQITPIGSPDTITIYCTFYGITMSNSFNKFKFFSRFLPTLPFSLHKSSKALMPCRCRTATWHYLHTTQNACIISKMYLYFPSFCNTHYPHTSILLLLSLLFHWYNYRYSCHCTPWGHYDIIIWSLLFSYPFLPTVCEDDC